jgi:hypothetical protein
MKILKVLAFVPLVALAILLMYLMTQYTADQRENRQRLILCVVSAFCNLPVLFVHYRYPPHPKYMILRRKRFSILVHIIGGSVEFFAAVAAFVTLWMLGSENVNFLRSPSQQFNIFARVMAGAAIVGHIPTAMYQTRIVFGVRALMLPAYILCIALHGYCAARLLWDPSPFWLYNTFLAFNIYAWVRVFYFAFIKLKLFRGSSYTAAVLFAGAMMGPAVLGPAAILLLFTFICVFDVIYWLVFIRSDRAERLFLTERERNTYRSEELRRLWAQLKLKALNVQGLSEEEKAKKVFDTLDTDATECLSGKEIKKLLVEWGVQKEYTNRLVRYLTKSGGVNFKYFYRHLWCFGKSEWLQPQSKKQSKRLEEERAKEPTKRSKPRKQKKREEKRRKAKVVFDRINLDESKEIDPFELQVLLCAWGVPQRDVERYLKQYEGRQNSFPVRSQSIDFEMFFKKMRPIWRFAYFDAVGDPLKEKASHMS